MSGLLVYTLDEDGYFLCSRSGDVDSVLMAIDIEQVDYTLKPPPDKVSRWQWVGNQWVVSNSNLAKKKVLDQQEVWSSIKSKRDEVIASGVYLASIGKVLHTNEAAVNNYSQIGFNIILGVFEPLTWKAMDGTFFEMTEAVFKELQSEMIAHTQDNYAKAEFHKAVMQMMDDPLDYDYSDGWITCKKPNEATE